MAHACGRFAPSPSNPLHVGNLRTAILAWLWARGTNRGFVLRIEDIDRVRPGAAESQMKDLHDIGITWDGEPLIQSTRYEAHADAINTLLSRGFLFECYCSRRDVREAASAPHVPPGHYPGTCLHLSDAERRHKRAVLAETGRVPALRLCAPVTEWTIFDELHGTVTAPVDHCVIRRHDKRPAYNLAVVVDDAFQHVNQITRGDDLLSQAPAQACIASLLGYEEPTYVHVPLALSISGERLAKRDGRASIKDLQKLGWNISDVIEWIGNSLGVESARSLHDLSEALPIESLRTLSTEPWHVILPTGGPSPKQ